MMRKGILSGAAALAALGMALVDVNNAEAGRRRCCCNANGWSGAYGTTQNAGYGPMNQAPPAPQTYDGQTQTSNGSAAPAPGYNQGTVQGAPYGTQYGPRRTTVNPRTNTNVQGGANIQGTNRDGTINPRAGEIRQGGQAAPTQRDLNDRLRNDGTQNDRQRNDGAAPPAPGSTDSSDSTQK